MSDTVSLLLIFIGLIAGVPLALRFMAHWLVQPSRKMMKEMEENCRRFTERMEHPDFAALEKHFGCRFPACLRALYANRDELSREHFLTMAAQDDPSAEWWHVAYYLPADGESVKEARPRLERYFAFADDGDGNVYLIDPRQEDPAVWFHDHEAGGLWPVCDHFTEFMKWPRVEVEE